MQKENMIRIWKEEISGEGLVEFVKKEGLFHFSGMTAEVGRFFFETILKCKFC